MRKPRKPAAKRLTFSQARWLRLLLKGIDPHNGLYGRSEYGGAVGTKQSLQAMGMLDVKYELTETGRQLAHRCQLAFDQGRANPVKPGAASGNWASA